MVCAIGHTSVATHEWSVGTVINGQYCLDFFQHKDRLSQQMNDQLEKSTLGHILLEKLIGFYPIGGSSVASGH